MESAYFLLTPMQCRISYVPTTQSNVMATVSTGDQQKIIAGENIHSKISPVKILCFISVLGAYAPKLLC